MTHALRLWRRQPVLALAAILSLALGIGANTAIFSVLNAVVLRPLPYHDADRLVIAWETTADNPARWVAPANFVDWSREARTFTSMAAFDGFAKAHGEAFSEIRPVNTTVVARLMDPRWHVELEVEAVLDSAG